MDFLSLSFYLFIVLFLLIYYVCPKKYRYIVIFIGSYFFYGYSNPRLLFILIAITIVTYTGGLSISGGGQGKNAKKYLILFFAVNTFILFAFKYSGFAVQNYNLVASRLLPGATTIGEINILLPIGLSFIIFQSCTYLTDVYRKNIEPEKNIIRYAAFVAFFPTILSGPIQKSRKLLPQIKCPGDFDGIQAQKGTLLLIWGLFEKVMVANKLFLIVDRVFGNYEKFNSAYYIIAAISFSLYIYADFSSYSDMARGIGKIMGIDVGKNFDNPYLSTTTSEFWNRWHVSLNSWFVENVYIPLGGSRKGAARKYLNVFVVFLISGLWHGASWHFVAWGIVNGLLVIAGQILKPVMRRICDRLKIDTNLESIVLCRRAIVFWLITLTWVFFRAGVGESFYIIRRVIFFDLLSFFDYDLLAIAGTNIDTFIALIAALVFCAVQVKRQNEHLMFEKYIRQPLLFQCVCAAFVIGICILAICSTSAEVNTQFLYFEF